MASLPVQPKKHLGQHFLNDANIARNIARSLQMTTPDHVIVEIGPGSGFLTQFLMDFPAKIELVETDLESVTFLTSRFPELSNQIHHTDVLKTLFAQFSDKPLSVIGNMPYNISGPLLFMALEQRNSIYEWVGMLQKEVADRIVAKPGTKAYGILSVLLQAYFNTESLFDVPPHVFIPPPKVTSSVIRMTPKRTEIPLCPYENMKAIVKTAFNQRRKMLRNSLRSYFNGEMLNEKIFQQRPEELTWRDFEKLLQMKDSNSNEQKV